MRVPGRAITGKSHSKFLYLRLCRRDPCQPRFRHREIQRSSPIFANHFHARRLVRTPPLYTFFQPCLLYRQPPDRSRRRRCYRWYVLPFHPGPEHPASSALCDTVLDARACGIKITDADGTWCSAVPPAPPPGEPVRRLQLPGIRQAPDEGCVSREQEHGGSQEDTGAGAEGVEGFADAEGGCCLLK